MKGYSMKKCLLILFAIFMVSFVPLKALQDLIKSFEIINKNKIVVKVKSRSFSRRFIKEDFFAEYDASIDLTKLHESIVTIPFILNIIPVVWLSNETYSINVMDRDLYYSLQKIREVFRIFYPRHSWSGELVPKKLITNNISPSYEQNQPALGLLFGGGLDSVSTLISHLDTKKLLITVWGADVKIKEEEKWAKVFEQRGNFSQMYKCDHTFVKSNFREFIETSYLSNKFPRWWVRASFGLSFVGLTAPLLVLRNIPILLISASHTVEYSNPHGSHSAIENNISFAGSVVCHAQVDKDRVQKVMNINIICKEKKLLLPNLRSCWSDSLGGNCLKCEKCIRTCTNIIAAGQTPEEYGFNIDIKNTEKNLRKFLERVKYLDPEQIRHWRCNLLHLDALLGSEHSTCATLFKNDIEKLRNFLLSVNFERYRNPRTRVYSLQERELFAKLWKQNMKEVKIVR